MAHFHSPHTLRGILDSGVVAWMQED